MNWKHLFLKIWNYWRTYLNSDLFTGHYVSFMLFHFYTANTYLTVSFRCFLWYLDFYWWCQSFRFTHRTLCFVSAILHLHSKQTYLTIWQSLLDVSFGILIFTDDANLSVSVCSAKADVVFVLDSSGSVGARDFSKMLSFVNQIVDSFDIASDKVRVGVERYNSRVYQEFHLDKYFDKTQLKNAISNIKFTNGGTNTGEALRQMNQHMFAPSKGNRAGKFKDVLSPSSQIKLYKLTGVHLLHCIFIVTPDEFYYQCKTAI